MSAAIDAYALRLLWEIEQHLVGCKSEREVAREVRRIAEREQARHEREEGNARRAAREHEPQPKDGPGDPKSNGVNAEAAAWLELAGEMPGEGA